MHDHRGMQEELSLPDSMHVWARHTTSITGKGLEVGALVRVAECLGQPTARRACHGEQPGQHQRPSHSKAGALTHDAAYDRSDLIMHARIHQRTVHVVSVNRRGLRFTVFLILSCRQGSFK